jgi:ketosteroid isomerase-like protein
MTSIVRRGAVLAAALAAFPFFPVPATAAGAPDVAAQTRLFLDAYARGDRASVLRLVDGEAVTVYGSDEDEVFTGAAAVGTMLEEDQRLWGGPATIGPMEHVSVVESGDVASVFFDAPFAVHGGPSIPVRFAMVWRRSHDAWRLVQSSNVVPTRGQSAARLLKRRETRS